MPSNSVKQRQPRGKRSRTGCRTCRVRRIKCDEAPERCWNCTSTGRVCDGYELYRLPFPAKDKRNRFLPLAPSVSNSVRWVVTSDERRCFAFFCDRTISDALGFYDSQLWEQIVVQMANQEPAVCHAVIALGAAHQDIIFRGLHLFPSSERKRGVWYLYSLEESARAFELLRRRNTQDPQMRQVMLLCCLLFVFLNLVQRDYDTAFRHLRAGLQVLTELNSSGLPLFGTSAHIPVDPCLLAAFAQLETQSTHFSVINLQLWDHQLEFSQPRDNESDLLHQSVDERRRMIEPLINAMFKFFKRCWTESESEIASHYGELQSIQTRLISEVHRATLSFAKFYAVRYASLTRKQQRGADLIRLCLLTQSVGLRTSLIHNNPELLLPFTPDYAALLSQSKKIIAQFPDRPTVMVDTGVILPLYIVADACQDLTLRWEAIQVLRDWPHYEGPYDSVLVSIILAERCRVQMRARVHNELRALLDNEQLSHAAFESMVEAELRAQMRIVISQRGDGDDTRPVGSQTQTEADVEAEFSQAMSLECQKWTCIRRIKKLKE